MPRLIARPTRTDLFPQAETAGRMVVCARCLAANGEWLRTCLRCGMRLPPPGETAHADRWQFSMSTLWMMSTLAAVAAALARWNAWLAGLFWLTASAGAVYVDFVRRKHYGGRRLTWEERLYEFALAIATAALFGITVIGAGVVCLIVILGVVSAFF